MKIKRFTGPDSARVMREIREAFGPEAVILETARAPDGLAITAAMDFDPAAYRAASAGPRLDCTDEDFEPSPPEPGAGDRQVPADAMATMRAEIQTIRSLLETQLPRLAWAEQSRRDPESAGIARKLSRLGLSPDVVRQLLQEATVPPGSNAWTESLRQLVDHIRVCDEDLIDNGGIFAVVGPTGAGKTTTIAKLAARFVDRHGRDGIALITTDGYRVGAREQLDSFGRLLGVPVLAADDADGLRQRLAELSDKRLILIDTAGMGQRDLRIARQLSWLRAAERAIRVLVTLPANAQAESMQEIVDVYRTAQPLAAILTKVDEAASLGGAFSVLIRSRLPLAYVTNGQRVPDDLHFARARQAWLVKASVELIRGSDQDVSEDYLAEHFAEATTNACA